MGGVIKIEKHKLAKFRLAVMPLTLMAAGIVTHPARAQTQQSVNLVWRFIISSSTCSVSTGSSNQTVSFPSSKAVTLSSPLTVNASLTLNCDGGSSVQPSLTISGSTTTTIGGLEHRQMKLMSGTDTVPYLIYTNVNDRNSSVKNQNAIYRNGVKTTVPNASLTVNGVANQNRFAVGNNTIGLFFQIPSGANVKRGDYRDSLTVIVEY